MIQKIKELCEGMGWIEITSNPLMISFKPEENTRVRMNIYHTTMMVTVQGRGSNGFCETYRNVGMEELEKILEESRR